MMDYNIYSKIPNELFYKSIDNFETEGILNLNNDDKLILILHELYVNTSMFKTGSCNTMLDFLIESCGYKVNQKSKKSFIISLNKLRELNLINFDGEVSNTKMFNINTKPLLIETNYTKLFESEVKQFEIISDLRLRTSLLKLYLYLKSRAYSNFNLDVEYKTYDSIEKYTKISQVKIKEYMCKLQEMNLITYHNGFDNIKINKNDEQICYPVIYVINNLHEDFESVLQEEVEIYRDKLIKEGYSIDDIDTKYFKIYYDDLKNIILNGVYLIRNLYNNTLKIGICSDLNRRFKEIEGSFKFCGIEPNLKIECFIECVDNYNLEQYLHKVFKEFNYQNEWFNIEDINIVIERVEEYMK